MPAVRIRRSRSDSGCVWAMREFGVAGEFDYAIINDRLEEAVDELLGICVAEHQRPQRLKTRLDAIREAYRLALEKDNP